MSINYENNQGIIDTHQSSGNGDNTLKLVIAGILFIVFMIGIIWFAGQVITLINEPNKLALATYFDTLDEPSRILEIDNAKAIIPVSFFMVAAIFFHILVLMIVGSILKAVLTSVWHLLSPSSTSYIRMIHSNLDDIKSKMTNYISRVN